MFRTNVLTGARLTSAVGRKNVRLKVPSEEGGTEKIGVLSVPF